MDKSHYLPGYQTQWKSYSPSGIKKLFQDAVKNKNGKIELVFQDKHNNKELIELWYASILALALHKYTQKKFLLISVPKTDPDIHFLNKENVNKNTQEGFPLEVTELFFHDNPIFDGNYDKILQRLQDTKSNKRYDRCHLLIVSRLITGDFSVNEFLERMSKSTWPYEKIWLCVYGKLHMSLEEKRWNFFGLPLKGSKDIRMNFNLAKDSKYFY